MRRDPFDRPGVRPGARAANIGSDGTLNTASGSYSSPPFGGIGAAVTGVPVLCIQVGRELVPIALGGFHEPE